MSNDKPTSVSDEIRETLSDVQHDIWAHWMRWQFSVCTPNEDGSMTIPAEKVQRWARQMNTEYRNLTDRERDSDREQADKIIAALKLRPVD